MGTSGAIVIAIATGVPVVTAVLLPLRSRSRARLLNVGSVSNRWVAEHYVG